MSCVGLEDGSREPHFELPHLGGAPTLGGLARERRRGALWNGLCPGVGKGLSFKTVGFRRSGPLQRCGGRALRPRSGREFEPSTHTTEQPSGTCSRQPVDRISLKTCPRPVRTPHLATQPFSISPPLSHGFSSGGQLCNGYVLLLLSGTVGTRHQYRYSRAVRYRARMFSTGTSG